MLSQNVKWWRRPKTSTLIGCRLAGPMHEVWTDHSCIGWPREVDFAFGWKQTAKQN